MSGKNSFYDLCVERVPDAFLTAEEWQAVQNERGSRMIVAIDGLSVLHINSTVKSVATGVITKRTSCEVINAVERVFERYATYAEIYFAIDKSKYVPLQKGHEQGLRAKTHDAKEEEHRAAREKTRNRMSLLAFRDPFDTWNAMQQKKIDGGELTEDELALTMGLMIDESTGCHEKRDALRQLLEQSFYWELPEPWHEMLRSDAHKCCLGGRDALMRYILTGFLIDRLSTYRIPASQTVHFDGHCLSVEMLSALSLDGHTPPEGSDLYDCPLRVISNLHPTRRNDRINVVAPFDPDYTNQLGEGECSVLFFVYKHYAIHAEPNVRYTYEVRATDTDLMFYALLMFMKIYIIGEMEPPELYLNISLCVKGALKTKIVHVGRLYRGWFDLLGKRHENIGGLVFSALASGGDYTCPYMGLTMRRFTDGYLNYYNRIGVPLRLDLDGGMCAVDSYMYRRAVAAAYYEAYKEKFLSAGIEYFTDLRNHDDLREVLNVSKVVRKRIVGGAAALVTLTGVVANRWSRFIDPTNTDFPIDEKQFKLLIRDLAYRFPDRAEIKRRTLAWIGCVKYMMQICQSSIDIPDPLDHGYMLRDPKGPLKRSNIAMCASDDWEGRVEKWNRMKAVEERRAIAGNGALGLIDACE